MHLNEYNRKVISVNSKEDLNSNSFLEYIKGENIYMVKKNDKNVIVIRNIQDIEQFLTNDSKETNSLKIMQTYFIIRDSQTIINEFTEYYLFQEFKPQDKFNNYRED